MTTQTDPRNGGGKPAWLVDSLGASGLPYSKIEDYRPVPESEFGSLFLPDRLQKGYHVEELADGVYWVTSGWYDTIFVRTGNGVIAVDAPPALGENLLAAIEEVTDEPVTHVVYSHWHADHIGAASIYGPKVKRIAHDYTRVQLERFPDPDRPVPTETFSKDRALEVNGVKLELSYKGHNHCEGLIFVYAPKQKVLAGIDICSPGWVAFRSCDASEHISGWVQAHDQLLEYDFDAYVGGHVSRYGNRDDVVVCRDYARDLSRYAREALETIPFDYFLEELGDGAYKGSFRSAEENYFNALTNYVTKKVLETVTSNGQTWAERVAGADVMTKDNAFWVIEKTRLEQSHNGYVQRGGKKPPKFFG